MLRVAMYFLIHYVQPIEKCLAKDMLLSGRIDNNGATLLAKA